jgi:hypothetical protein
MRQTKIIREKLPNINAKFFIEKILCYLGLAETKPRIKNGVNNDKIWNNFTQYKRDTVVLKEDVDINTPPCLSYGTFLSNSIKSVSLRL